MSLFHHFHHYCIVLVRNMSKNVSINMIIVDEQDLGAIEEHSHL